eukprot:4751031-Amphidinium_carterae.1
MLTTACLPCFELMLNKSNNFLLTPQISSYVKEPYHTRPHDCNDHSVLIMLVVCMEPSLTGCSLKEPILLMKGQALSYGSMPPEGSGETSDTL